MHRWQDLPLKTFSMINFNQRLSIPRRAPDERDQRPNIPRKADEKVHGPNPNVQLPPVSGKATKMLNLALIQTFHPVVMHHHQRPNIPKKQTKECTTPSQKHSILQ
jgi:hypothetical protein